MPRRSQHNVFSCQPPAIISPITPLPGINSLRCGAVKNHRSREEGKIRTRLTHPCGSKLSRPLSQHLSVIFFPFAVMHELAIHNQFRILSTRQERSNMTIQCISRRARQRSYPGGSTWGSGELEGGCCPHLGQIGLCDLLRVVSPRENFPPDNLRVWTHKS